jgi:RNA polymerase sigma-70 factor (ECF subfamily)
MKSADIMMIKLGNAGMNFNSLRELILNVVRNTMKKVGYYYEEDLTQDIFMKIFDKIVDFDEERGNLKPWVARITKNAVIDHLRKQNKIDYNTISMDEGMYISHENDDYLLKEELFQIFEREITYLSEREQALINYKYLKGKSGREIAKEFGINENQVPMHVRRAKEKLKHRVNMRMAA